MRYKSSKDFFSKCSSVFFHPAKYQRCVRDILATTSREGFEEGMLRRCHQKFSILYFLACSILFYETIERALFFEKSNSNQLIVPLYREHFWIFWHDDLQGVREGVITESESESLSARDDSLSEIILSDNFFHERPIKIFWVEFCIEVPEIHPFSDRDKNSTRDKSMSEFICTIFGGSIFPLQILLQIHERPELESSFPHFLYNFVQIHIGCLCFIER